MRIACIVAMSQDRVIGLDNKLPWHLPEDLKYFKRITMGCPIIMGRKTFDSIGRPLPGRTNIVASRQRGWAADGVVSVSSAEAALQKGIERARRDGADEVFVIGGEELFRQLLNQVDRLYLTEVDTRIPEGDAFFPELDLDLWQEVGREEHVAGQGNPYNYRFRVLDRCQE